MTRTSWMGDEMDPVLFADAEGATAGNAAGIIGGVVTLLGGLWVILRQFLKDRREAADGAKKATAEEEKTRRVDTIAELKNLLDIQRNDFEAFKKESKERIDRLEKELDTEQRRSHECDRKTDRMNAHIYYLEATIRQANPKIEFRPWSEVSGGSGPHAPISQEKS